jgi:hypothetical protein
MGKTGTTIGVEKTAMSSSRWPSCLALTRRSGHFAQVLLDHEKLHVIAINL